MIPKKLYDEGTVASAMLQLLDTTDLSGAAPFIVPIQCDQGRRKESTQQWLRPCCCTPSAAQETEAIRFWHQILWLDRWYLLCGYPTGVVSCPLGPCSIANSYNTRRIAIVLPILRGWTRRRLQLILESNGRRPGPTGVCSSRLATIEMVTEKATFVC